MVQERKQWSANKHWQTKSNTERENQTKKSSWLVHPLALFVIVAEKLLRRRRRSRFWSYSMSSQGQGIDEAVLDDIIRRLTEVRLARPGKQVQLSESEIKQLCVASRDIFINQPNLLELEAPIKICGTLSFLFSLSNLLPFSV